MTPTEPLPLAASDFSCAIAEKSLVNEVAEMLIGVLEEPEEPELALLEPPDELLPQADTTRPTPSIAAANARLLVDSKMFPPGSGLRDAADTLSCGRLRLRFMNGA